MKIRKMETRIYVAARPGRGCEFVVDVVVKASCSREQRDAKWDALGGSLRFLVSVYLERGQAGVQEVDKGRREPKQ